MKFRIALLTYLLLKVFESVNGQESFCKFENSANHFALVANGVSVPMLVDSVDFWGVLRAVNDLQNDIKKVSEVSPTILKNSPVNSKRVLIIGTVGKNSVILQLIKSKKINPTDIVGKREKFIIQTVSNPFPNVDEALVIAGSDMRGTIYGVYELSEQIGVSPWYYWADVPVKKHQNIYIKNGIYTDGEPAVRYRGIFLNDEAPALSGWSKMTFGGFNHKFYEKVFELLLRLKGNFIWPAMWGSAFFDDDPENGELANKMGIVVSTSHHEPMGKAHAEWKKYGSGKWDYNKNETVLKHFWQKGFERQKDFETVVTLGMRGDGDEPMSEDANIGLLEKIVKNQRDIIKKVSEKKITETPQVWALYKEVQDYYDKGMRVPDDVTLLLCDDNWGNVRKLPAPDAKPHKGGYGMYYHFDYVGGPRNYKWLNVTPVQKVWEQMNLTYSHGVDRIWIVNVGDLKPMEYPISFFLDMAWNPSQFNAQNLLVHTEKWCAQQFGEEYAKEAARIINLYTKYNRRVTPELLNDMTYSLDNYNEFERITNDYKTLALDAHRLNELIPEDVKDAFYQLVLFPVDACSNLYEMYFAVAKNKKLAALNNNGANFWADKAKECYDRDSVFTLKYNKGISNGKWNHMMDQIRIGYTYWQQPDKRVMPSVIRVEATGSKPVCALQPEDARYISIEAEHFSRKNETGGIRWEIIPDLGKTLSGVTTLPQNSYPKMTDEIYLEYDMEFDTIGEFDVHILVSPTLNFNSNKGLRYAVSFDGASKQIVNINGKYDNRQMEKWQARSINETITQHKIEKTGKHTLRFSVLEPGIVLQKIMVNTGGLKNSYLGAPEKL
jgi:hypothetical protein